MSQPSISCFMLDIETQKQLRFTKMPVLEETVQLWSLSEFIVVVLLIIDRLHADTEPTPVRGDGDILLEVSQSVVEAVLDVQIRGISNNRWSEFVLILECLDQ